MPTDLDDSHGVPILFAKELHNIISPSYLLIRHFDPGYGLVFRDSRVHQSLDFPQVLGSQRVTVKVEAEVVGTNERTFLANPFADYLVQCPMKQVSCGAICFDKPEPRDIGPQSHFVGHSKFSFWRKA